MRTAHRFARHRWLECMAVVITAIGCQKSALPPPVSVTHRPSVVGAGEVVVITNDSDHHLYNVEVVGRDFGDGSSGSVRVSEHLAPGETIEAGWLEFESWVPEPGQSVEVYADDYLTPEVYVIPDE